MSFAYHLNIEPLALEIAREHIRQMDDEVIDEKTPPFLNKAALVNNLKNGYIAVVMLCSYVEGVINSFLNTTADLNNSAYWWNFDKKINAIAKFYNKPTLLNELKNSRGYNSYKDVSNVRNALVHYKNTFAGYAGNVPDISIGRHYLSKILTRGQMETDLKQIIEMCKYIAVECNLKVNEDVEMVSFEGMDGDITYIEKKN